MKKSILESSKQLFLIVFSVVLGIYLSERLEERKKEKEATLLMSKIKLEVNDNKTLLENWIPYHIEVVSRLDSLQENETFINNFVADKSTLFKEALTRGTLMSRFPTSDAWDIAKSHPLIVHFDYEELLILSKIYNQQEMTYAPIQKVFELALSPDFNTEERTKPNIEILKSQLREITTREQQLLHYIKEAETILDLEK